MDAEQPSSGQPVSCECGTNFSPDEHDEGTEPSAEHSSANNHNDTANNGNASQVDSEDSIDQRPLSSATTRDKHHIGYRKLRQADIADGVDATVEFCLYSGEACDLVLSVGHSRISCHQGVLCRYSLYFDAMFDSGMKESRANAVQLGDDVNTHDFLDLLHYFYTGELGIYPSNVQTLTELSSQFQVTDVLRRCCDLLLTLIEDDLCLSLVRLSNLLMLGDVYDASRRHALWHFGTVRHTEDFQSAPSAQIVDLLQDSHLHVGSEVEVFAAAAGWFTAQDTPCPVTDLTHFFGDAVNFHLMSDEEMASLRDLPEVVSDRVLNNFVASLTSGDIASLKTKHPSRVRTSPKDRRILCVGAHKCSPLAGCQDDACPVAREETAPLDVMGFEPDGCRLDRLATLSDHYPALGLDAGYKTCVIGEQVYVVGGQAALGQAGGWLNWVWRLDTIRWTWTDVCRLPTIRRHHGMCTYGSKLFIVGGIGKYRIRLDTVESYDTETNQWSNLPSMLHQETAPAVTHLRGNVFVLKNYTQVYNFAAAQWSFLELSPSVPGLPLFAHPHPTLNAIYVSCFNSESLWLVDLEKGESRQLESFDKPGRGGAWLGGRVFHFQLQEFQENGSVQVEAYDTKENTCSVVGVLHDTFLTSHFVTVPGFPRFLPSSTNKLC